LIVVSILEKSLRGLACQEVPFFCPTPLSARNRKQQPERQGAWCMIGKTVGHYRITARLGAGGMGEVFLAEDTRLDRKAAIKFLPAEMAADPERRQRFLN
jgi:serine/threonine protein kinase